jgi:hypothetical protein
VSTLHKHVHAARAGYTIERNGRPPLLSRDDEDEIAAWVRYRACVNLPATRLDIRIAAAKIAAARGHRGRQFATSDGLPGQRWWDGFNRRYPDLRTRRHHRLPQGLPSRDEILTWLVGLHALLLEQNLNDKRLYNVDETGIDGRYGRGTRIVHVDGEEPCVVGPTWRGHFTCVVTICADGSYLPPMFIAQGSGPISDEHARMMTRDCIRGTGVVQTVSGWIDNPTWSIWLQFFVTHISAREKPTAERPVILILDSHQSRYSWQSLQYAQDNHVIIYALLPNSTSICQPLDVGFFGPFKVLPNIYLRMPFVLFFSFIHLFLSVVGVGGA